MKANALNRDAQVAITRRCSVLIALSSIAAIDDAVAGERRRRCGTFAAVAH
ncbi:hypothetical protein [Bradyrhizobium mercantei]|uniref:hypothetical protein n=1 Tax=Bradyrhizobium mercantei TaxID=1904807 RepID=UPI0013565DD9|nr:hypothetical protein [Bradyrhizobium mercantei]